MRSLSAKAIKYYLFLINLIFAVTGVILIATGAIIKSSYADFGKAVDDKFYSAPIFLIVVGSIIFLISSIGCCGAVRESRGLIILFSVLLGVILFLEVTIGVIGYLIANTANDLVNESFKESMKNYNNNNTDIKHEWDNWQQQLNCCGVHNYTDWKQYINYIPQSCCSPNKNAPCTENSSSLHTTGCLTVLTNELKGSAHSIEIAVLLISIVHIISIICACKLSRAIKESMYESV